MKPSPRLTLARAIDNAFEIVCRSAQQLPYDCSKTQTDYQQFEEKSQSAVVLVFVDGPEQDYPYKADDKGVLLINVVGALSAYGRER